MTHGIDVTTMDRGILIEFIDINGFMCLASRDQVASVACQFENILSSASNGNGKFAFSLQANASMNVNVTGTLTQPQLDMAAFTLHVGAFVDANMPSHLESQWGAIPVRKLPVNEDNICSVASHR